MMSELLQVESENINEMKVLQHKRVLIVGLGKTGLSCARFLSQRGVEVAITDSRAAPPALEELQSMLPDVAVFIGGFDAEAFQRATCIVISPGISVREPLIAEARSRGVEILGDIEIFAQNVNAPVIAITGSNGKSTVTTLLGEMAKADNLDVRVGGNIGIPALDLLHDPVPDLYILELSSFQLETTESLNAEASVILNISEDHMDRYHNLADYTAAKAKIYHGSGILVINLDDDCVVETSSLIRRGRNFVGFTLQKPDKNNYGLCKNEDKDWLCCGNELLISTDEIKIKGQHNIANSLAAIALGDAVNIRRSAMLTALKTFPGLEHRSQWVCSHNGVDWYNDSKATNVGAAIAAITGIPAVKIVLIAGGQGKEQDFSVLREAISSKVKHVILLGQDANIIEMALSGVVPVSHVESMEQAVSEANRLSSPGDVVLLSPACASFDMFSGYEDRGEKFIAATREILQ